MSYPSEQDIKQNLKQVCKTLDGKEWVLGNATLSGKGYAHLLWYEFSRKIFFTQSFSVVWWEMIARETKWTRP